MPNTPGRNRLSGQQRWFLAGYRLGLPCAAIAMAEQAFRYADTPIGVTKGLLAAVLVALWLTSLWRPLAAIASGVWVITGVVWATVAEAIYLLGSDVTAGTALAREIGLWVPIVCAYWAMILYARPHLAVTLVVSLCGVLLATDLYMRSAAGSSVLYSTPIQSAAQMVVLVALVWVFSGVHGKVISQRDAARITAIRDPLTGLHNRLSFEYEFHRIIREVDREGHDLCLIVLDIDHFKRFNDRYGHLAGDAALKAAASLCRQTLRRTDLICRWGGEEFAVILPQAEGQHASRAAEKLRQAVAGHNLECGEPLTISCGVAKYIPGELPRSLFERADAALLQAKARGRNQVVCCPLTDCPTTASPTT